LNDFNCVTWGPLLPEALRHVDCEVVVTTENFHKITASQRKLVGNNLPRVCPCDCTPCKRAWEAEGRPVVISGKVVRQ
jgi:hypothetical protein